MPTIIRRYIYTIANWALFVVLLKQKPLLRLPNRGDLWALLTLASISSGCTTPELRDPAPPLASQTPAARIAQSLPIPPPNAHYDSLGRTPSPAPIAPGAHLASVPTQPTAPGTVVATPASFAQALPVELSVASPIQADSEQVLEVITPSAKPQFQGAPVEFFVQQALAVHPSIIAARQRVAAEFDRIPQVSALPNPQFNNTFWPIADNAIQTAGGRIANQMSLQQGIPFPDKLRTQAAIVSREAQIAQAEVEGLEREIAETVRLAYYELWFASRALEIVDETRYLVADLTTVAEARYRSGGSQQDVLRAQLEADRIDDRLAQLRRKKQAAQADLAALLRQPASLQPEAAPDLDVANSPMQLDALIAQAEQCNPDLRGLSAQIQRDREKQQLACLERYPDFVLGLNWGIVSDERNVLSPVANGNDNISFMFGTTLPIWRQKIDAGVREAGRRTRSTQQQFEAERDSISGRLRRYLSQANTLVEQIDIYERRIIPRAQDTLKIAVADYRGQQTDFFTLVETYRELLMFELQLARINATLAGTIAQIDRHVGCGI